MNTDTAIQKYIKDSGFINKEGICYMISLLQCLFSVKQFYCFFYKNKYKDFLKTPLSSEETERKKCIGYVLHKIIKHKNNKDKTFEYLEALSLMIKEKAKNRRIKYNMDLNPKGGNPVYCFEDIKDIMLDQFTDRSVIDIFKIKQTTTSNCESEYFVHEMPDDMYYAIYLITEINETQINLENVIINDEYMYVIEKCECGKEGSVYKNTINNTNEVVVFYNALNDTNNKVINLVFPLTDYKMCDMLYDLIGAVYGCIIDGDAHAIAVCKSLFDNKWYIYDNDKVTHVNYSADMFEIIKKTHGYNEPIMLFYVRK